MIDDNLDNFPPKVGLCCNARQTPVVPDSGL